VIGRRARQHQRESLKDPEAESLGHFPVERKVMSKGKDRIVYRDKDGDW
jgi:hypothetical protein